MNNSLQEVNEYLGNIDTTVDKNSVTSLDDWETYLDYVTYTSTEIAEPATF